MTQFRSDIPVAKDLNSASSVLYVTVFCKADFHSKMFPSHDIKYSDVDLRSLDPPQSASQCIVMHFITLSFTNKPSHHLSSQPGILNNVGIVANESSLVYSCKGLTLR